MRILIVNTVTTEKNGITNVMFNYLNNIEGNDIVFDLVSQNQPERPYVDAIEKKGGKVYVIDKFGSLPKYMLLLRTLIKKQGYDAVHIHANSHTVLVELIAAWQGGCANRIVHAHNTSCKNPKLHKLLTKPFHALCTHGLACGEAAGEFMFDDKPFVVVNNGVDVDRFSFSQCKRESTRAKWNISNDTIVIGHVGNFNLAKNQSFIVDVFEFLCCKSDQYRLVLIGDGKLRADIKSKVDHLGLADKVIFTGNINNVDEALNGIDIILMPSLYEGLPLTLVEQQANGLRGVVSENITREADKTGNLEYVSLDTPLDKWAAAVESHSSNVNRQEMSEEAIKSITRAGYNIKIEAKKLENYYLKLNKS